MMILEFFFLFSSIGPTDASDLLAPRAFSSISEPIRFGRISLQAWNHAWYVLEAKLKSPEHIFLQNDATSCLFEKIGSKAGRWIKSGGILMRANFW
jgi:hypothetical protein